MTTSTAKPSVAARQELPAQEAIDRLRALLDEVAQAAERGGTVLDELALLQQAALEAATTAAAAAATAASVGNGASRKQGEGRGEKASAADNGARAALMAVQTDALALDRICEPAEIEHHLMEKAHLLGLRTLLLRERGRALRIEGMANLGEISAERKARLEQIDVPREPDSLLGVVGNERSIYSGPRPNRGLPVDLMLVMGRKAPLWCLVVPLPYRNRWATFLYVDADAANFEALLQFEVLARLAVLQIKASRTRPHQPGDKVNAFRVQALRDVQKRKQREAEERVLRARLEKQVAESTEAEVEADPALEVSSAALKLEDTEGRFDADGNLIRPLTGDEILEKVGDLPPMPQVATRVMAMLNDPDVDIGELQKVISTDQALAGRLLQIANSSFFGGNSEATTIAEAVMRLGFTAIRSWLMASVTRNVFLSDGAAQAVHRVWRQSILTAVAAQDLARRSAAVDAETAFVGGLMQNIGLLLIARSHPIVFDEIENLCAQRGVGYETVERQLLGFDHADLSGMILYEWGLGETLVSAIASHHRLEVITEDDRLAAAIALAERMVLSLPDEGFCERDDVALAESLEARALGLDIGDIETSFEELIASLDDPSLFNL